jgi:archaellum component FlaC
VTEQCIKRVTGNIHNTQLQELEDIYEVMNKIKDGISEAAGKIIGKEERL